MVLLSAILLVLTKGMGLSIPAQTVATITAFAGLIVAAILDHLRHQAAAHLAAHQAAEAHREQVLTTALTQFLQVLADGLPTVRPHKEVSHDTPPQ